MARIRLIRHYKGKTIGFCCPACIEKFNAEPEKYMAGIDKAKKECVIECPECGAKIDIMEQCKKGRMKGACPMMKGVCPMMEKTKLEKEENDEHHH